jgi:hypothetical protein
VVVAHPLRVGALALVVGLMLLVSTILFAALLSVSLAFCSLLSCRYVLPLADRLEGRPTRPLPVAS